MLNRTPIPETKCPHCGGPLDAAICPAGRSAKVGSLSLCKWCSGVVQIADGMRLVAVADADLTADNARKVKSGRAMLLDALGPAPRSWA